MILVLTILKPDAVNTNRRKKDITETLVSDKQELLRIGIVFS